MLRVEVESGNRIRVLLGFGMRARTLTLGSRETRAALHRGDVSLVLLSSDGSPRDRERLARIAEEQGALARVVATSAELGAWVGRDRIAAIGVRDRALARGIADAAGDPEVDREGSGEHAQE